MSDKEPAQKYPIIHRSHLYQYDDHVFVWFDEVGQIGGASAYLDDAIQQQKNYLKWIDTGE
jgi:hypothetical protein